MSKQRKPKRSILEGMTEEEIFNRLQWNANCYYSFPEEFRRFVQGVQVVRAYSSFTLAEIRGAFFPLEFSWNALLNLRSNFGGDPTMDASIDYLRKKYSEMIRYMERSKEK